MLTINYRGERLHIQVNPEDNPLKTALMGQIQLMSKVVGFDRMLGIKSWPWESLARERNNRKLQDALLSRVEAAVESASLTSTADEVDTDRPRTLLEIALTRVLKDASKSQGSSGPSRLDQQSIDSIIANLKLFLFAGHDTTSSTICWMLKLLQDNPECLRLLRAEHDSILGSDPSRAASLLRESPQLLNKLVYTHGVVKEALRLYPLAATVRQGEPGFSLSVPGSDLQYPTEETAIHDMPSVIQLDPSVWPRAEEFLPQRWVPTDDPDDELYRPAAYKDAWRPFSMGPRNCIGMELAMVEVKLVAALTCREFDVREAWDEWDESRGVAGEKRDSVDGERLYGCGQGVQHPKDGMPVQVRRREYSPK